MTADIITLYIQIFCIITFTLYVVYVLAVIPLYKSLPLKIVKIYNSVMLSSGVLLSTVISYFAVNSFNISKPAAYILYLFLFIFLFVLYIAVIFKPFY